MFAWHISAVLSNTCVYAKENHPAPVASDGFHLCPSRILVSGSGDQPKAPLRLGWWVLFFTSVHTIDHKCTLCSGTGTLILNNSQSPVSSAGTITTFKQHPTPASVSLLLISQHFDTETRSVFLSVCLSVFLSVCLSACLYVCLSACLSVCLSVCLPVCLF